MRKITVLPFVFLLPACGLFNKVKKSTFQQKLQTEERLDVQEAEQLHTQKQESLLLLNQTAAGLTYRLEIWPKGSFTFSPEKGFAGEAERLLYQEQGFNSATGSMLRSVKQDSMQRRQKVIKQSVKQEFAVKEAHRVLQPPFFVYVMMALLLLSFAAWLWWKLKWNGLEW